MRDRELEFRRYRSGLNLRFARLTTSAAAALMPGGVVFDWFTQRDLFREFTLLRIGAALVCILLYRLTFARRANEFAFELGFAPILVSAIAIQIMIQKLGGYVSPYYAGISLRLTGTAIAFYWSLREIVVASTVVVGIWMVPALVEGVIDPSLEPTVKSE